MQVLIAVSLSAAVAIAYYALIVRFIMRGAFWLVPFFCLYCTLFVVRLIFWAQALTHPPGVGWLPYFEPALIGLKVCTLLEAFGLVTEKLARRERLLMLYLAGWISMMVLIRTIGLHSDFYLAVHAHTNTVLAASSVVWFACLWIVPHVGFRPGERNHCAILMLYFVKSALCGLIPPATASGWLCMNVCGLGMSLVCCGLWWRYGLIRTPRALTADSMLEMRSASSLSRISL